MTDKKTITEARKKRRQGMTHTFRVLFGTKS